MTHHASRITEGSPSQPPPWDAEDAFPLKPKGPEYGYFSRGRSYTCTRDELIQECARTVRDISLVWTPDSPRFVTAWELSFLAEALRQRSLIWLRQRIQIAGLVLLLLGGLAAVNWKSRSFPVYVAVAVFMGLLPLFLAIRIRGKLRRGTFNAAQMARLTRFKLWIGRRPKGAAWLLVASLAVAAAWQFIVGLYRSLEFAGHLKTMVLQGEPWRLLTGGLIHAGLLHFCLNVLALVTLGKIVEALSSRSYVFLVFLVSILTGGVASQLMNLAANSVGASGGIMGLLGFLLVFATRRPGVLPVSIRNWIFLMVLGVVGLGVAAPGLIDNAGHGGGFVGGVILAWFMISRAKPDTPLHAAGLLRVLGAVSVAIVAVASLALPLTTTSNGLYHRLTLVGQFTVQADPENAERVATRAIRLKPDLPTGYEIRGRARNFLGDHEGALADLSKAVSIDPSLANAYISRSLARSALGDFKGALSDCDEAWKAGANGWKVAAVRLEALEGLGRYEEALTSVDDAIAARPEEVELRVSRGWILILLGRFDEALKECETALSLKPDDAHAVNNRGLAKAGKGDLDGAILDYSEAIRRDPEHPFALSNRGDAKLLKGDRDGALEDYGAALKRDPEDEDALFGRGRVKHTSGDARSARADIVEALRVAPPGWYRRAEAEAALKDLPSNP